MQKNLSTNVINGSVAQTVSIEPSVQPAENESMNAHNVTPPSKRKTSQKATKTQAPKKIRRNLPPMKNLNESEKMKSLVEQLILIIKLNHIR